MASTTRRLFVLCNKNPIERQSLRGVSAPGSISWWLLDACALLGILSMWENVPRRKRLPLSELLLVAARKTFSGAPPHKPCSLSLYYPDVCHTPSAKLPGEGDGLPSDCRLIRVCVWAKDIVSFPES